MGLLFFSTLYILSFLIHNLSRISIDNEISNIERTISLISMNYAELDIRYLPNTISYMKIEEKAEPNQKNLTTSEIEVIRESIIAIDLAIVKSMDYSSPIFWSQYEL